ncbi:recombinase family protein [Thalassotalea hakodatensis]|uniref:recombinase family protein n=1 Tax=Thalassotalea hakodatensis TaxID=3030492 RepID=UPI002573C747|nr:recombinase family protein [Thalassotalea hakodatensis]
MRTFAYLRTSTDSQTTDQQMMVIENAGYTVEPHRQIVETISGKVPALKRPEFALLVNKLEVGDTLIVNKLDRLGRNNVDLQLTVEQLVNTGIRVICLDLPTQDLSSAEGKLMLQLFASFAEFERNRISDRTKEALNKKKADGVKLGRPLATSTTEQVHQCKAGGLSQSKTSKKLGISIATVKRHWNKQ